MPATSTFFAQPNLQYRWVFIISLLLSAWLIWLDPLINRDAIIYLRAADAYLLDGLAASQEVYPRPILPIIIALIHNLTGLPLLPIGLVLNSLFYAALCIGFVATVRTLGGDRSVQLIAAVVILSHPWLNHTRSAIMREPAYLLFMIWSMRELLLYQRNPVLKHQLRWLGLTVMASLFRFEGLFFLALAPLAILFCNGLDGRWRHSIRMLAPAWLIIISAGLALSYLQSQQNDSSPLFPAITYYISQLVSFQENFSVAVTQAGGSMLAFTSQDDAPVAVFAALLAILLLNLARALSWPWVIALAWGHFINFESRFRADDRVIIRSYVLIGLFYLLIFVLINRFMLERYCNQVVIFLLLYVPFLLSRLWHAGGWRKFLTVAVLVGLSIDTLHSSDRQKLFIAEATEWIRENTPENATLVTNEKYIAYFSNRDVDWELFAERRHQLEDIVSSEKLWRDSDYLVLYLKPGDYQKWTAFLEENSLQVLHAFPGAKKGKVSVVALPQAGLKKLEIPPPPA